MPQPPSDKLHKHTLFLRKGDFDFLSDRFPRLSASRVIRKVVANFVDKLDRPVDDDQIAEILEDERLETSPNEEVDQ